MEINNHVLVKESNKSEFITNGKILSIDENKKEALIFLYSDFKQPIYQLNSELVVKEIRNKWVSFDLLRKLEPFKKVSFKINKINTSDLNYNMSDAYSIEGDDELIIKSKFTYIDDNEKDLKNRMKLIKNQNLPSFQDSFLKITKDKEESHKIEELEIHDITNDCLLKYRILDGQQDVI